MYHPDVRQLRQFYSSHSGRRVRLYLGAAIRRIWPDIGSDLMMGYGYACPMLRLFLPHESTMQLVPVMPEPQGALYWPQHSSNRSLLAQEERLPFAQNVFNRILLLHGLECADDPDALLAECWRTLAAGGRMLVIVPNRKGWWASGTTNPFAYGHPYHTSQLKELMLRAHFTPIDVSYALYAPPVSSRRFGRISALLESLGRSLMPMLGGVILMEVEKQIYAGIKEPALYAKRQKAFASARAKPAMTRQ